MKNKFTLIPKPLLIFLLCITLKVSAFGQYSGRVVINEFMPWSNCNPNSEFIELLNFGPGPINIGCYILTNGRFSVTIPPNTILQPRQFYVVAGQNTLATGCGNIDSTVRVHLNWNTCGCTNVPIPTNNGGFFADGGNANEKILLLTPDLVVVDAVSRDMVPSLSDPITTPTLNGACASRTFDLDMMTIAYESLNMSTGVNNSFARTLDGDCLWLKDPPQSANATNNRSGDRSAINYNFTMVAARDCNNMGGSIDIVVDVSDTTVVKEVRSIFPMNYIVAYDENRNGTFDLSGGDRYWTGFDDTPPSVAVLGLPLGKYRVTVSSVAGCYLANFDFDVLPCDPTLRLNVPYFKIANTNSTTHTFEWMLHNLENIRTVSLEKSSDGINFIPEAILNELSIKGTRTFTRMVPNSSAYTYYRLHMVNNDGQSSYSIVINTGSKNLGSALLFPNPAKNNIQLLLQSPAAQTINYKILNIHSATVATGTASVTTGANTIKLPVQNLAPGIYHLVMMPAESKPISVRFVIQP